MSLTSGTRLVFAAVSKRDRFGIYAGSIDSPERKLIALAASGAIYAEPGLPAVHAPERARGALIQRPPS